MLRNRNIVLKLGRELVLSESSLGALHRMSQSFKQILYTLVVITLHRRKLEFLESKQSALQPQSWHELGSTLKLKLIHHSKTTVDSGCFDI